jgi:bifunctional DNase/RNase
MEHEKVFISKVEICDIKDNTYYANIHFISEGKTFFLDARPSDAITIALKHKAPIFVADKVITQWHDAEDQVEAVDQSEEGKKWTEYLQKLSPDDFGKYKV